ncbi:MAG: CHAP domain-containing protein [Propionibacteriaceae bacterium]|jgi:hypothetical protein|nr:CHAP domain-containing protein [Propionibacteriaceae bacterium]
MTAILGPARAQLGYRSTGANPFNLWYGWDHYEPWCDAFVSWCAEQAGQASAVGKFAYCPSHVNSFKRAGRWIGKTTPQPGDVVFFDWNLDGLADHVGIVEAVEGGFVKTIEGNTGSYPGEVARRSYSLGYGLIQGYARPAYTDTPAPAPTPSGVDINVSYRVKQNGAWGPEVANGETAGVPGVPITGAMVRVDKGSVWYQAHNTGGGWNGQVTGYNGDDYWNGWAGDNVPIDLLKVYLSSPRRDLVARYRVSPIGGSFFDWQRDDETGTSRDGLPQDGYAGLPGSPVDQLQITVAPW